jgi:hypothetical protein
MTEAETAWAAGLFEGEGSIFSKRKIDGHTRPGYLTLRLSMTDEDVVRRFRSTVGVGNVSGWETRRGYKPIWTWVANGRDAAQLLDDLRPWFGHRRAQRSAEALRLHEVWLRSARRSPRRVAA